MRRLLRHLPAPQSTTFELPTVVFLQNQAGTGPVDSVGANHNTASNASGNSATATGAGSANGSAGSIAQQGGPGAQGPSASGQQAVGLQSAAAASGGAANESEAIAATQASQQVALGTNTGSIGSLAGANAAAADGAVQSGAVNASALAGASINAAGSSGAGAGATGNVPTLSQQPITSANGEPVVVRTVSSGPTLPSSSLYVVNAQNGNHPLVETDPAFTNRQNWLSSDYMLQALSLDPALQQKRLGDGFYEQQLVQQQIAQLTGRRFLGTTPATTLSIRHCCKTAPPSPRRMVCARGGTQRRAGGAADQRSGLAGLPERHHAGWLRAKRAGSQGLCSGPTRRSQRHRHSDQRRHDIRQNRWRCQ